MSVDPLNDRLPGLRLRPLDIGRFPTPVEPLGLVPSGRGRLWCKREDLSGEAYGGNKVRKLRWLLPAARERGGLVTLGALGSNYLLAASVYGPPNGVPIDGVVFPQPPTEHVRTNLTLLAERARLWPVSGDLGVLPAVLRARRQGARERGAVPAFAWAGGSTPLGVLGWVSGALELGEQVRRGELPAPTDLVATLGSGGMAAGLLLGLQLAGLPTRLHAIQVAAWPFSSRVLTLWLARAAARLLRAHGAAAPDPDPGRLVVHTRWLGPGYGHPTPEAEAALARAEAEVGMHLETTYTAKTLAAALTLMDEGALGAEVLWINSLSSTLPSRLGKPLPPELRRWIDLG